MSCCVPPAPRHRPAWAPVFLSVRRGGAPWRALQGHGNACACTRVQLCTHAHRHACTRANADTEACACAHRDKPALNARVCKRILAQTRPRRDTGTTQQAGGSASSCPPTQEVRRGHEVPAVSPRAQQPTGGPGWEFGVAGGGHSSHGEGTGRTRGPPCPPGAVVAPTLTPFSLGADMGGTRRAAEGMEGGETLEPTPLPLAAPSPPRRPSFPRRYIKARSQELKGQKCLT